MNSLINQLLSIKNPEEFYRKMMNSNPQFAQFVRENKGKSPEQIAREHGINPQVLSLFR